MKVLKLGKTNKKYHLRDWMHIYEFISTQDYIRAKRNVDLDALIEYITGCEFDIEINENGTLNLIDLQEAYLGGAEYPYENFKDIIEACERLEGSFLCDYWNIYYWEVE